MNHRLSLSEFVQNHSDDFKGSSNSLLNIINKISNASKIVSSDLRRAGLVNHIIGSKGTINVQGEDQQNLDVFADQTFKLEIELSEEVCGIASEENDDFIAFNSEKGKLGNYVVLFDPLDGSSNIDVNVSVGTIFSIYRRISPIGSEATLEDMLQCGTKQLVAGYVLYGSSTMLVYTTGNGVNGFTMDPSSGEFFLSHPNMIMPETGRLYAMNEGNINECEEGLKNYILYCQSRENQTGMPYSGRYIGSLVADFHRNLIKGGIYIYPDVLNAPEGKLRLLYECNPLAFIAEQAGGLATTGRERILEIQPKSLHQRIPYYVGSRQMIEKAHSYIASKN